MTTGEWLDIVDWVNTRLPNGWTPEQAKAYKQDVDGFDPADVWDAVTRFYTKGAVFAPTGGQLVDTCKQIVRNKARNQPAVLPEPVPSGWGSGTWEDSRARLGFGGLSLNEAAAQRHASLFPAGCVWGCDIHPNGVT